MTWWKASSVTVTAGQSTVTVNTGDDIGMIKGAEGLVISNQPPVEIKRSYLNASVMMLELMAPWPYATQSGQPAIAFPTDGDLAAATAVLKQLIDGFQIATELQMQEATNNVHAASALRVKQAIDFHRPKQTNPRDNTTDRVLTTGFAGLGLNYEQFAALPLPSSLSGGELNTGGLYRYVDTTIERPPFGSGFGVVFHISIISAGGLNYGVQMAFDYAANVTAFRRLAGTWQPWVEFYSTSNTTVDSNGFVKSASPIVKLFKDKIMLNGDFSAVYERIATGHYLVKDTCGFAETGWYIETPRDANGNVKVFVEYEQLADKTIVIKTYDPDYSNGKAAAGIPCDIPTDRWIDIRLKEPDQIS